MFISTDDRSGGEWPGREVSSQASSQQTSDSAGVFLLAFLFAIFAIAAVTAYALTYSAAEMVSNIHTEPKAS